MSWLPRQSYSQAGLSSPKFDDLPFGERGSKTWRERLIPTSKWGKLLIGVCTVQAVITLVLEITITVFHLQQVASAKFTHRPGLDMGQSGSYMEERMTQSLSVLVYHYIFMSAQVFLVAGCWDAVLRKNTLQLLGMVLFSYLSIAYTYIQSAQHANMNMNDITHLATMHDVFVHNTVPYEMTIIGVVAAGSIFMTPIAWLLYQEFGWEIYKKLGADLSISHMYRYHQILMTFLKFDLFFFVAFSVQLVVLALDVSHTERLIQVILAIPLSVVMVCVAIFALHRENRILLAVFIGTVILSIGYMIYKLARIIVLINDPDDPYVSSRKFLIFFVVITLVLALVTLVLSFICLQNFGRGLLEHRRQHKLGVVAAPPDATPEEARRISMLNRYSLASDRLVLE